MFAIVLAVLLQSSPAFADVPPGPEPGCRCAQTGGLPWAGAPLILLAGAAVRRRSRER